MYFTNRDIILMLVDISWYSINCNCSMYLQIVHLKILYIIYFVLFLYNFIFTYLNLFKHKLISNPQLLFTFPICFFIWKAVLVLFWHDYICLGGLRVVLQCRSEVRRGTIRSVDRLRGAGGAAPWETDPRSRLPRAYH